MVTVVLSTIGASGADYTTPQLWEADTDNDLVAADELHVGLLFPELFTYTGTLTIAGAVTDATRYRVLMPLGAYFNPITAAGPQLQSSTASAVNVNERYSKLIGVGVDVSSTGAGTLICVAIGASGGNNVIHGCYLTMDTGTGVTLGIVNLVNLAGRGSTISSTIVNSAGSTTTAGILEGYRLGREDKALNCIAYNLARTGSVGFQLGTGIIDLTIKNCIATDTVSADFGAITPTNLTLTHCISEDTSATTLETGGGSTCFDGEAAANLYLDAAGSFFFPAAGAVSINAGTDLTADIADYRGLHTDLRRILHNQDGEGWEIGPYNRNTGPRYAAYDEPRRQMMRALLGR